MGRCIIKMGGKYLEWGSIVDAPVAGPFDLAGLEAYVRERYGSEGVSGLRLRLARADAIGTSSLDGESTEELISVNRAGPGESCLSVAQVEALYVRGEAPELWVYEFVPGPHEALKATPRPVVAYCEADAARVFDDATESETQPENWRRVPLMAILDLPDRERPYTNRLYAGHFCLGERAKRRALPEGTTIVPCPAEGEEGDRP